MKSILYTKYYLRALIMLIFAFSLCGASFGESLDQVVNPRKAYNRWVSDMAGVIEDGTEARLNALIDQLEQKTTAEIAVVTVQRTDGSAPKEFATELLNRWGVGKKGKDNGALVLLVMGDRRIEVETGYGIEGVLPDGKVGEILDKYVIPQFKQGDFGGGIFAGVQAMARVISQEELETEPMTATETPKSVARKAMPSAGIRFGGIALVVILASFIGFVAWRSKIRRCEKCRKQMRKLNEEQDDAYLSFDQKLEEDLGSVDYRVWRCDDCQTYKIERTIRHFTNYEDCPQCKHRTVYVKSHKLSEPTYWQEGLEEITRVCRFPKCTYSSSSQRVIPRRQPPAQRNFGRGFALGTLGGFSAGRSSSRGSSGGSFGGGSFGGGSSGGGGAGRSW